MEVVRALAVFGSIFLQCRSGATCGLPLSTSLLNVYWSAGLPSGSSKTDQYHERLPTMIEDEGKN